MFVALRDYHRIRTKVMLEKFCDPYDDSES